MADAAPSAPQDRMLHLLRGTLRFEVRLKIRREIEHRDRRSITAKRTPAGIEMVERLKTAMTAASDQGSGVVPLRT